MSKNHAVFVEPLNAVVMRSVIEGNVTVAELKTLRHSIEKRLNYVVRMIADITEYNLDWWDFDNLNEEAETNGFFDVDRHTNFVSIVIAGKPTRYKDNVFDVYQEKVPFDFVWTNFEDIVKKQYESFKTNIDKNLAEVEEQNKIKNEKFREMVDSIRAKLTVEELAYVQFKQPSRKHKK